MREGQPARDVERLAELVVPVCCARDGPEIAARAVGLLGELGVPASCVGSGPLVAAGRGVADRARRACRLREGAAWRSQRESQSRWLSSLCRPACCVSGGLGANARVVEPLAKLADWEPLADFAEPAGW